MRIQDLIFLVFIFIAPSVVCGQDTKVVQDFRSRTSIGLEIEISKDFDFFSELEYGTEENLSKLGKIHGELGINYSPSKYLKFETKYRYTKNRINYSDDYKLTNLLTLSASFRYKIYRVILDYRIQYQSYDDESMWNETDTEENVLKNRMKIKYDIRKTKLEPFLFSEIYHNSGIYGLAASKLKTVAGIEFPLTKWSSMKLYYRNDRELKSDIPYTYHTMGLSVNFEIK